jgi:hypothetical protein
MTRVMPAIIDGVRESGALAPCGIFARMAANRRIAL